MEEAARRIHARGARHVLVKGGHLRPTRPTSCGTGREVMRFDAPRIESPNTTEPAARSRRDRRGLAQGRPLADAVRDAKAYVRRAIRDGFQPGHGVGALRHFISEW